MKITNVLEDSCQELLKHKKQIVAVAGGIGAALGIGGIAGIVKHARDNSGVVVISDKDGYSVADKENMEEIKVVEYDEDSKE